jgi:hypothetical protein
MTHPCPKCAKTLKPSGEIDFAGRLLPVYQCSKCSRTVEFLGLKTRVQVTFCDDETGMFDPDSPDEPFPAPSRN